MIALYFLLKTTNLIINAIDHQTEVIDAICEKFNNSKYLLFPKIESSERKNWVRKNIAIIFDDHENSIEMNSSPEHISDDLEDENVPLANILTAQGKKIGDYELTRFLKSENETEIHVALQISINRKVSLTLLKRHLTQSTTSIENFRETVRAKAKVSHPNIAAVYEGHEDDGYLFYTSELMNGQSLENAIDYGIKFNQGQIISLLKVIVDTQIYLKSNQIPHTPLQASDIYINSDGTTRIANTATKNHRNIQYDKLNIKYLIKSTKHLVEKNIDPKISSFLNSLLNSTGTLTWERFAEKISSYENQISNTIENSSVEPEKKSVHFFLALGSFILIITTLGILLNVDRDKSEIFTNTNQDLMIRIDGGEFIYQNGEIKILPTFWIDKYETTISEYKTFLDAIKLDDVGKYKHPEQPVEKISHKPKYWDQYFKAAKLGGTFSGHHISLNSPVIYVDWWDAYAYARWKGRRLPTEEEWEKSGRGKTGNLYTWGNDSLKDSKKSINNNFKKWIDVHLIHLDLTKDGIAGLMSNVSEWTITLEKDPEIIGNSVPVIRGGNFKSSKQDPNQLLDRKAVENRSFKSELIGFRTLTDINPRFKFDISK